MIPRSKVLRSLIFACWMTPVVSFALDNEPVDTEPATICSEERESNCGCRSKRSVDYSTAVYLPESAHIVSQISVTGDEVRFEDGSTWKVNPYDATQAIHWLQNGTPVSVMQNTSWFSTYPFRIVNKATGTSISANLFQGPWKGGEKTQYVTIFEAYSGTMNLQNGTGTEITHWKIHPSDIHRLNEWNFNGDYIPVIVGHNADYDGTWNSEWESLLINVRKTGSFVRAHQY